MNRREFIKVINGKVLVLSLSPVIFATARKLKKNIITISGIQPESRILVAKNTGKSYIETDDIIYNEEVYDYKSVITLGNVDEKISNIIVRIRKGSPPYFKPFQMELNLQREFGEHYHICQVRDD